MKPVQQKKYVANSPADFKEALTSAEMELQKGLNIQILQNWYIYILLECNIMILYIKTNSNNFTVIN